MYVAYSSHLQEKWLVLASHNSPVFNKEKVFIYFIKVLNHKI